ncbi:PucR family transcriptional regulator [Nocardioides dilutus]
MDGLVQQRRAVAAAIRARRDDFGERFSRRLREAVPEYYAVDQSDLQQAGWSAMYVLVDEVLDVLAGATPPTTLDRSLVDEATAAARSDLPWEVLDRTYRLTHQALWEEVFPVLAELRLPRADQALLLRQVSDVFFTYFDRQAEAAHRVFDAARQEESERSQRRLRERVAQVLEGVAVRDVELGYRLGQDHLALVAWGVDVEASVRGLAARMGAELLLVEAGSGHVWGWLGLASSEVGDPAGAVRPAAGTHVALGSVSAGREGFVTSHREARLAASLGARGLVPSTVPVIRFDQVALLAAALEDEVTARVCADHLLAPLEAAGSRTAELADTLVVWARTGLSPSAAGRQLAVSERTVRYRVERLEELLGGDLRTRLPELVLAVEISRALDLQRRSRSSAGVAEEP